jgi:WD40 repeat protein
LRVWDLETGHSRVFEGHSSSIYAVAMTPDGRRVVSGGWDKTLRVWELATGHSRVFEAPWSDAAVVHAIAVTPDGRRAVSGTGSGLGRRMDDTLCVWDLETGRSRILKVHTKEFFDVAVTADGRHAVSGRRLWDLETGHSRVFEANMGGVIAVTEDGWRAVSFTADGRVMAQDPKTGYPRTLEGDWLVITAVSLDGRRAVSRENFEICMGDRTVAVTPDGRHAVSVWQWLGGRTVRVWDLETGRWRALDGHMGTVNAVAVTPDGRRAVSGSDDRTVRVWNLEAGRSCAPPEGHNAALGICTVAVARYGQRAFSTGNALDDTTLRVWDLDTGHSRVLEGCTGTVNQLAETPDGRYAIRGSQVWDLETGRVLQGAAGTVNAVTVTPDGRRAVCGSQVWDLETGYPRVPGQKAWALGSVFAVAPDRRCAVGRQEKTLHVWDLATGGCRVFEGHPSNITAVAMTPDGRGVVSGSGWRSSVDRNSPLRTVLKHADLRVWDLATGHSRVLQDFRDDITAVAVTPDGRRAVSGGHDKTLRVWHLETGHSRILEGHTDSVWTVAVTPDGRHAVSGSYDDTLRVWDIETGEVVAIYTSAAGSVDSVAQRFPTLVVKPRRGGCIEILQLMGNNGPRIATAARLWLSAPDTGGGWDSAFTAVCDACGRRFSAPAAVLDSITAITRDARLGPNDSPCLNLPAEAWAEPHLLSECPLCHEPLKFNPFVVDNRDRYSAP